jgi:hypothetical protein
VEAVRSETQKSSKTLIDQIKKLEAGKKPLMQIIFSFQSDIDGLKGRNRYLQEEFRRLEIKVAKYKSTDDNKLINIESKNFKSQKVLETTFLDFKNFLRRLFSASNYKFRDSSKFFEEKAEENVRDKSELDEEENEPPITIFDYMEFDRLVD